MVLAVIISVAQGTKNQPELFLHLVFLRPPRSWTSVPLGQGRPGHVHPTVFLRSQRWVGRPPGYPPGRPRDLLPKNFFFLRSCRSSSVNSFDFSQGNLENLVGNLEGIFRHFLTHRTKAQKIRGKIRSIFRKKILAPKKSFVQNSVCRRATLKTSLWAAFPFLIASVQQ